MRRFGAVHLFVNGSIELRDWRFTHLPLFLTLPPTTAMLVLAAEPSLRDFGGLPIFLPLAVFLKGRLEA
jgi:hypothetical protein